VVLTIAAAVLAAWIAGTLGWTALPAWMHLRRNVRTNDDALRADEGKRHEPLNDAKVQPRCDSQTPTDRRATASADPNELLPGPEDIVAFAADHLPYQLPAMKQPGCSI
jgi:hypothetical protein